MGNLPLRVVPGHADPVRVVAAGVSRCTGFRELCSAETRTGLALHLPLAKLRLRLDCPAAGHPSRCLRGSCGLTRTPQTR